MRVAAVGRALPAHVYGQEELLAALRAYWTGTPARLDRLEALHRNVSVGTRHLALPLEEYYRIGNFGDANAAWARVALDLGEQAVRDALGRAGLAPTDLGAIFFVSVTGIATPSIDARLVNRVGLSPRIKRVPVFGLGCVAGAAGIARAADYVRAFPRENALLLAVELCSLTIQRRDLSIANLIASGLFGDGAAAAIVSGAERDAEGPRVVATRSIFYPGTEHVMGWDITDTGFRVVLSADVPEVVGRYLRHDIDQFLADHGLRQRDIASWICHPGGPKVLEAFRRELDAPDGAFDLTWDSLREVGNLSSASVLFVLGDTLARRPPPPGSFGLLLAMGPGFCSELVLLQW